MENQNIFQRQNCWNAISGLARDQIRHGLGLLAEHHGSRNNRSWNDDHRLYPTPQDSQAEMNCVTMASRVVSIFYKHLIIVREFTEPLDPYIRVIYVYKHVCYYAYMLAICIS